VQDLGPHDRGVSGAVDLGEDLLELALCDEERERLVVGTVDRHAHVVQHRSQSDHHLGVGDFHLVVRHDGGLDAGLDQEPQHAHGDVHDDLHVHGPVVRHLETLHGVDVRRGPQPVQVVVVVHPVDDPAKLGVAAAGLVEHDAMLEALVHAPVELSRLKNLVPAQAVFTHNASSQLPTRSAPSWTTTVPTMWS